MILASYFGAMLFPSFMRIQYYRYILLHFAYLNCCDITDRFLN
ncbi:hypothetical protein BN1221_00929c [Brenneria goodwinii]|uniref:Uncharacterized protein n=1 Tax=Brenneria goodwinii TaxID=1109412 RepID=A0A0G4JRG4_9GAMM|nr:hypothetical protein BN1221_00929c [Brenneria goodwinii]